MAMRVSESSVNHRDVVEQLRLEKQVLKRAFIREQQLRSELEAKLAKRDRESEHAGHAEREISTQVMIAIEFSTYFFRSFYDQ